MNAEVELDELERWLDTATRGLPAESRGWVREELQFHYEDAVRERCLAVRISGRGASRGTGRTRLRGRHQR